MCNHRTCPFSSWLGICVIECGLLVSCKECFIYRASKGKETNMTEEYGYCSYCGTRILKSELDLNDGLCENCATQMDDDMDEEG